MRALAAVMLALVAACSAPGGSAVPVAAPRFAPARIVPDHNETITFRFKIFKQTAALSTSISVVGYDITHTTRLAAHAHDTAPGAPGCTALDHAKFFYCIVGLQLPPGSRYSIDATARSGTSSQALLTRYGVLVGATKRTIGVSLGGNPVALEVRVQNNLFAGGSQAKGFHFGGNGAYAAQTLVVTPIDAADEIVTAPSPPPVDLVTYDRHFLVNAVPYTFPSAFVVEPLGQSGPIAFTATMHASGGNLVAKFTIANDPIAWVIDCWNTTVSAYAPWSAQPIVTLDSNSNIDANSAMALDSAGNLYLANHLAPYDSVAGISIFAPGRTTAAREITNVNYPQFVAVGRGGNVFANENDQDVAEYAPDGGSTPTRVISGGNPHGLAVDSKGNLYVANDAGVSIYAPGASTTPTATISNGTNQAQWLALDRSRHLYVANAGSSTVTKYAPPFSNSSAPVQTFGSSATISGPAALAVDAKGNVYLVNGVTQNVVEFAADGSVVRTISGLTVDGTNLVATDPLGNAYVPVEGPTQALNVYAPGISTTASHAYTSAMSGPMDVVVWP